MPLLILLLLPLSIPMPRLLERMFDDDDDATCDDDDDDDNAILRERAAISPYSAAVADESEDMKCLHGQDVAVVLERRG